VLDPAFIKQGLNYPSFSVPPVPQQPEQRSPKNNLDDGRMTLNKMMGGGAGLRGISVGRGSHQLDNDDRQMFDISSTFVEEFR
jgi:hypothetical protein